jgi:glutathione S-transferase
MPDQAGRQVFSPTISAVIPTRAPRPARCILLSCATMTKPKLSYFDSPVSRGEECRLALHLAGVDFEDVRIKSADWPALKPNTPYGAVPTFELPGKPMLAHSNAILVLIGRRHGLHPTDDFEAARHEGMMQHVEALRTLVDPTFRMNDPATKKAAREAIAATTLPMWAGYAEKNITGEPFFGGAKLNVVDLKLYMVVRWFTSGSLDHIPTTVFAEYPKLLRVHDAVRDHAGVKAWYAKT